MKVALVHDWLTGMRGGEKCLEVLCELYPDADLYTLVYVPDAVSPIIRRMKVRASWLDRLPAGPNYFRYLLPLFPRVVERWDLSGYDLILSSSHCVAKGVWPQRALHVAYVHAAMRYAWDLHDAYFTGVGGSVVSRVGLSLVRTYLQRWDINSTARVHHLVANSSNVAEKIKRFYGRTSRIIYPPVEVERFFIAPEVQSFYLIVSALVPYKRIDLAIEAFNALQLPLRIVGSGPLRRSLEQRANANIEFLGWLENSKIAELYASCQALIFPGEDDFGIAPLEAQASGRPVIGFKRGGLLETVIGIDGSPDSQPTGIFFNEQTAASLISAVRLFESNRNRFVPDRIRAHSLGFGRQRFKQEVSEYIEVCLKHRRGGV